jgi:hypothetical protein
MACIIWLFLSRKRFDRQRWLTGLQASPIRQKFSLMQFCPSLDQPALAPGKCSSNPLDGIQAKNCYRILIIGMKMG